MKFSESWLREWVNPNIGTQALIEKLTMAGLEVDAVEPVTGDFSGVVVGEIIEVAQHPDADKLRICQVDGHAEGRKQVVCGAPNARVGIKIPFATVGAKLPPDQDGKPFKIKKAKLRGIESLGMLCGQTELQLGDDDSGLFELPLNAPVGEDLRQYLALEDNIIEVDLTPNRSDCLSIAGLAREVGVLCKLPVSLPEHSLPEVVSKASYDVKVSANAACPKYTYRVIEGIDNSVASPLWLQEKLRRSGIRSIDAVVDVTNYVLLELGQPMHAFDLSKLKGAIDVRFARDDEPLTLLNDQEVKLSSNTLVIADESGAIAMAGIMGGASTCVEAKTQTVVLESAYFDPIVIAGKARNYGLHTDSSHRFERGVDYNQAERALDRATQLLLAIVGGSAGTAEAVISENALPTDKTVRLNQSSIGSKLGFSIPNSEVEDILTRLGLTLMQTDESGWLFGIPSYRFDINIDADLLEELARIYGYNNLPTTTFSLPAALPAKPEGKISLDSIKDYLAGIGMQEAITYSFIDPALHSQLFNTQTVVEVLNPISQDMSVMRTSLVPGLLQTLTKNLNKQINRVSIFETGLRFVPSHEYDPKTLNGLAQIPTLSALIYGSKNANGWNEEKRNVDFYDLKAILEPLLISTKANITYKPLSDHSLLHPGQSASVCLNGVAIGYIGALHPQKAKQLGLNQTAYVFELDVEPLLLTRIPKFNAISKYPEVARDLAIIVDKHITCSALETEIRSKAGGYLKQLKVFDVYQGKGIDSKAKSIAFNLIFQHSSRTLTEEEINAPMSSIVKHLEDTFNAQLR